MARCCTATATRALAAAGVLALFSAIGLALWLVLREPTSSDGSALVAANEAERSDDSLAAPDGSRARVGDPVQLEDVRREERGDRSAALPANAVLLRVVDATGAPVAGIPVGLIDVASYPL